MRLKDLLFIMGGAILCLTLSFSLTALAQQNPPPHDPQISAEKMEAIRACAAAKGVEMPASPKRNQSNGFGGLSNPPPGPPPEGSTGGPPRHSEEQRAIMDACFKANGVEPPRGPPPSRG